MDAAAASIAFIQITTDIVKCVVKARKLWQQIKDIPDEIREMLSDMDDLGIMFEGIKNQLESDNSPLSLNDPSVIRSLDIARQACEGLAKLITDMNTKISSKKGLKKKAAVLKITMKKENLDQYQQRLYRLISRLQLSAQFYNIALTSRTPEMISRRVTADLTTYMDRRQVEAPKLISRLVTADLTTYMDTQKTTKWPAPSFGEEQTQEGWFTKNTSVSPTGKPIAKPKRTSSFKLGKLELDYAKGTGAWQARIQWPSWLSESIYEVASNPSPSGWMCNFRIYNVVSFHSEIITKVRSGDKDGVLELFRTRKASPFDVDQTGTSLLYFAADKRNYDICKLLLRMGLDDRLVVPNTPRFECPLMSLVTAPPSERQIGGEPEKNRQRIVELFNSYMDAPESTLILKAFNMLVGYDYGDAGVAAFQKSFLPKLYTSPLRDRLEGFRLGSFQMTSRYVLTMFLEENARGTFHDVSQSTREQLSLVHSAALALGIRFADDVVFPGKMFPVMRQYNDRWSELVQQIGAVADYEDLNSIETVTPWDAYHVPVWRGTPLISAIGGALCYMSPDLEFYHWDNVFQKTIQEWVLNLQVAGVDLVEYGRREVIALGQARGALDADAIVMSRNQARPPGGVRHYTGSVRGKWNENHWVPIRLLGLEVGPCPEDWRLIWAPEFEWMACQFWKLIQKEEDIVVPGSWVES
ncbi:hypothetical protein AK830_g5949 [Neonectria ditissima]|uniref:Uncharacterized protein n=1 Tax=Neonectria ditissima TaxID=78410 RepID=A0A0P7BI03_9HYPO|nr:hypothetical protein AK830_g5949 [Neonectria ditissima]